MTKFLSLLFVVTFFSGFSYGQPPLDSIVHEAPDSFVVKFETTKGAFEVEAYRDWSSRAVDRFYHLVKEGFYDSTALFRVQPDYVVQFGIADKPSEKNYWENHPIPDEPVRKSNKKGTVAYAREGKNSRTTQLFINYSDNFKLDTTIFNGLKGFPPFAKVVDGMEVINRFYSEYGFEPATKQDSIYKYGNEYLKDQYPHLDYIHRAIIVGESKK